MANEEQKSEGISCACDKVDLYKESLKVNLNNKAKVSDPISSNSKDDISSLLNNGSKEDQKSTRAKK